jgi:pimeloyl-ACP methyl ester carboxylesterase
MRIGTLVAQRSSAPSLQVPQMTQDFTNSRWHEPGSLLRSGLSFRLALQSEGKSARTVEGYLETLELFDRWLGTEDHSHRPGEVSAQPVREAWRSIPTTVVLGRQDQETTPERLVWAEEHFEDVRVVDTQHNIGFRDPGIVASIIIDLIEPT